MISNNGSLSYYFILRYNLYHERSDIYDAIHCLSSGTALLLKSDCHAHYFDVVQMSSLYLAVMPIDGAWSEWSSWGECKASCGNGQMNRYRYCNSPAPAHGGRFCRGDTVEWKPCVVHCDRKYW